MLVAVLLVGLTAARSAPAQERLYSLGMEFSSEEDLLAYRAMPRYRSQLPASVDLAPLLPTPGDQERQLSCVGWATAYTLRSYYYANSRGASHSASTIASPSYIYNSLRRGNCDGGLLLDDALTLLRDEGVLPIGQFAYDQSTCSRLPTPEERGRAGAMRIAGFHRLERRLDDIRGRLAQGHPVLIGVRTPAMLHTIEDSSVYRRPPQVEWGGGHAMVAVGYDEGREAVRIVNSWGTGWGDGGYAWIHYDFFGDMLEEAWTIEAEPIADPPPPAPSSVLEIFIEALQGHVDDIACSSLDVSFRGETLVIRGFLGDAADLDRLRDDIRNAEDRWDRSPAAETLPDIIIEADLRPWPQCEALLTLAPALDSGWPVDLRVSGRDDAAVMLRGGDDLVFEVTSPGYRSYLYLAYIQADGETAWLVQPHSVLTPASNPSTVQRVGDGTAPWGRFRVSEPYGAEVAIAIASASPLFEEPRAQVEIERDFLSALSLAVNRQPRVGGVLQMSADIVTITTEE